MFKSLRSKLSLICGMLIIWIAIVGINSTYNISVITQKLEKLMIDNYNSISTAYSMRDFLQKQNESIRTYLYDDKDKGISEYYEYSQNFTESFFSEKSNITEEGELESVEKIQKSYEEYKKRFSVLQEIYNDNGLKSAEEYYNQEVNKLYDGIIAEITYIKDINENAMINSKQKVIDEAIDSKYSTLIISIIAVISGIIMASYLLKRILEPLKKLNESIVDVRQGNIGKQIQVVSNDEIGELTEEFNRMGKRLQEFEKSTMGKVLREKNMTLAIIKSIKEPIIVLDKEYRISVLNQACQSFFDIDENLYRDKYISQVIKCDELFEAIYELNNKDLSDKIIQLFKDEKEYYFKLSINSIINEKNEVVGCIVAMQDVTRLKEVDKVKNDFLSTISHEFKTSLTSILIGTSLIENSKIGTLTDKQREIIDTMREDGDRLNDLISNLITLRKIQSNKEFFSYEECSVKEIVGTSITTVKTLAKDKDILIESDVEDGLRRIIGDREKLVWVINNLITNSIKNCDKGDIITIRAFKESDKLGIQITDTGRGIPKELIESIFNKYTKLNDDNEIMKSFGLGLSICKEIIEGHHGKISCDSELGMGATFKIILGFEGEK